MSNIFETQASISWGPSDPDPHKISVVWVFNGFNLHETSAESLEVLNSISCSKRRVGCGFAPDPTNLLWEVYGAPRTPRLDFRKRGALQRKKEGREWGNGKRKGGKEDQELGRVRPVCLGTEWHHWLETRYYAHLCILSTVRRRMKYDVLRGRSNLPSARDFMQLSHIPSSVIWLSHCMFSRGYLSRGPR